MVFKHSDYDKLMTDTFAEMTKLGKLKGGEYAGDDDRLANFRRNGNDLGLPMETVWRVYAGKHWDAISQYVKDLNTGKTRDRLESVSGRVDDLLVYLILFKCILIERENTKNAVDALSTAMGSAGVMGQFAATSHPASYTTEDITVALRDDIWDVVRAGNGGMSINGIARHLGKPENIIAECLRRMERENKVRQAKANGLWYIAG